MRSGLVALCLGLVLTGIVAASPPSQQTSGSGSETVPERLRDVETLFLEGLDQTQVFVRVAPRGSNGRVIAARIAFVALYNGNVSRPGAIGGPPDELTIQAQGSGAIFHASDVFRITLPPRPAIDLLAPPARVRAGRGCDDCGFTSLIVTLDPAVLVAIAQAHGVTANVLGMPCELDQPDLDAIAAFARKIRVVT